MRLSPFARAVSLAALLGTAACCRSAADCLQLSATDGLLVIDVQNSFMEEYELKGAGPPTYPIPPEEKTEDGARTVAGSLAVSGSSQILGGINEWMESFVASGGQVFASLDWHPVSHCSFCRNGTAQSNPKYYHPDGALCFGVGKDVENFDATGRCVDREALNTYANDKLVQWPDHCMQGEYAARFHPYLQVPKAATVVKKGFKHDYDSYSAFGGSLSKQQWPFDTEDTVAVLQDRSELSSLIHSKNVRRLFVLGLAIDYCVLHSTLDALGKDPSSGRSPVEGVEQVIFVEGLSRGVSPSTTSAAVAQMQEAGAIVVSSTTIGKALAEVCQQSGLTSCQTE